MSNKATEKKPQDDRVAYVAAPDGMKHVDEVEISAPPTVRGDDD